LHVFKEELQHYVHESVWYIVLQMFSDFIDDFGSQFLAFLMLIDSNWWQAIASVLLRRCWWQAIATGSKAIIGGKL